jgi:hypothetical protein
MKSPRETSRNLLEAARVLGEQGGAQNVPLLSLIHSLPAPLPAPNNKGSYNLLIDWVTDSVWQWQGARPSPSGRGRAAPSLRRDRHETGSKLTANSRHNENNGPSIPTVLPVSDPPLTLAEAAALYGLKVAQLRTERARGRLVVFPIGGGRFTTHADMREMLRLCRLEGLHRRRMPVARRWRGATPARRPGTKRPFPDLPPPK